MARALSISGLLRRWFLYDDVRSRCAWRALTLAGGNPARARPVEEALLTDTLNRYAFGVVDSEQTVLPAAGAWFDALNLATWSAPTWQPDPRATSGTVAALVQLGYIPQAWVRESGLSTPPPISFRSPSHSQAEGCTNGHAAERPDDPGRDNPRGRGVPK